MTIVPFQGMGRDRLIGKLIPHLLTFSLDTQNLTERRNRALPSYSHPFARSLLTPSALHGQNNTKKELKIIRRRGETNVKNLGTLIAAQLSL